MPVIVDHQARIGERWGTRVITGLGGRNNHQLYQWQCSACGSQGQTSYASLVKSSICLSCPRPHQRKRPFESLYNHFQATSKKRGLLVEISYEEFLQFTAVATCHYCGASIKWSKHSESGLAYNLDRIENDKGYTLDNCVVCCPRCNWSRGSKFSYNEWLLMTAHLRMARECPFIGIAE